MELNSNEGQESQHDWLDFQIEKTNQSFFESGKVLGQAFLTHLFLLCITVLLVFGRGVQDSVSIPFLQLSVTKAYAAIVSLFLYCAALFWFWLSLVNHDLLADRLVKLIEKRYRVQIKSTWNLSYPSLYKTAEYIYQASPSALIFMTFFLFHLSLILLSFGLPLRLVWDIGDALQLTSWLKLMVCAATFLFLLPAFSMYLLVTDEGGKGDKLLKELSK